MRKFVSCLWALILMVAIAWPGSHLISPRTAGASALVDQLDTQPGSPLELKTATGGPDAYGYQWDDQATWDGKDFSSATQLFPEDPDEEQRFGVAGPINMSFSFPFYERSYSQVYVSVEGLLGFSASLADENNPHAGNLPMPSDILPDNLVAPFWDNLTVPVTGKVRYLSNADYFAVQWANVTTSVTETIPITFQVVLYSSGNIGFYYDSIPPNYAEATVGIEDGDGVDGLQYLFNSTGITDNTAILFTRPGPAHRVKMMPLHQGGLTIGGASEYKIYVRNSGDFTENYNLEVVQSLWEAAFYAASGDQMISNTGDLSPGQTFTATLKVKAPDIIPGESAEIQLRAASTSTPNLQADVSVRTAVPSAFVVTSRQNLSIQTDLISPFNWYTIDTGYSFNGGSFAVGRAANQRYVSVLYNSNDRLVSYLMFDSVGTSLFPAYRTLPRDGDQIDTHPVSAMIPDGRVGIAWLRQQSNISGFRLNVYFQILNAQGDPLLPEPLNITAAPNESGINYRRLRIAATDNNRFVMTWQEDRNTDTESTNDIGWAIYNVNTSALTKGVLYPALFDTIYYDNPGLFTFQDSSNRWRAMIVYNYINPPTREVRADVLKIEDGQDGVKETTAKTMFSGSAENVAGVQLTDAVKRLAMLWMDQDNGELRLRLMGRDPTYTTALNLTIAQPTIDIDGRAPFNGSIIRDNLGHAIVTWNDNKRQRLYYILVNASGKRHEPIVFRSIDTIVGLETSALTQGNASYIPWWRNILPLILR